MIYKENRYSLCLPHYKSNSHKWLQENLINAKDNDEFNIKIRLDPLANNFLYIIEKMVVYRQDIKWQDLINLNEENHSQFINISDGTITDLVWKSNGNELHLTCEELPDINNCHIMGSRYLHAIYYKDLDIITHFDGSLRIYNNNELNYRKNYHVIIPILEKLVKELKFFR